ncbi:sulfotransferase family protein [Acuticoccus kandeliae]|uniref:sulfotransferase family protein n=1 Tax=Acuticoccus kandeliae TaxID=2073160 RepID=UPI00130018BF|nr:sulfotransferase family protein [Acuticoccus kandeliae]
MEQARTIEQSFRASYGRYAARYGRHRLNYKTNISARYRYVYVETAKVACSSIKQTLQSAEFGRPGLRYAHPQDVHRRELSPLLRPEQFAAVDVFTAPDFFRFCFVRNPFSRLLSAYLDKIAGGKPQKAKILGALGRPEDDFSHPVPFETFVAIVCDQDDEAMDLHWRPQSTETMIEDVRYDFIGRAERFEADFAAVLNRVGIDPALYASRQDAHRTGADEKLRMHYTCEMEQRVVRRFARDFALFGYPPEIGA